MPRKKTAVPTNTVPESPSVEVNETPQAVAPKPKRTRSKPTAEAAPIVEAVATEPEAAAEPKPRSRRAPKPKTPEAPVVEAISEAQPALEPEAAPAAKAGTSRRRTKPASATTPQPVAAEDDDLLVIAEWRPRSSAAAPAQEKPEQKERNPRRRRGGKDQPKPAAEPKASPEEGGAEEIAATFRERKKEKPEPKKEEPKEEIVVRPAIPIPDHAPQVVLRNGVPTLVKGKKVYPPLFFFGKPSDERRAHTVFEEIALAGEAGVHLHVLFLELSVDESALDATCAEAAYLLATALKTDPEAEIIFRVVFSPERNWEQRFPDARYIGDEGQVCQPSVCDDNFWSVAEKCLGQFIKRMRLLPQASRLMGIHLDYAEWFTVSSNGYDTSKAALGKFRSWVKKRYANDEVTLRAAWFDGAVTFDGITVPRYEPEGAEGEKFVRSSRKQRRYVDYHLFVSDAAMERVANLAYCVKESSQGELLCGASYGYTFEWSHPNNGHLALGKLLRTREIDFVAGPPSYRNREPGGTAPFPGPIDSFAINGKLYISEEDFKTSLSGTQEPDDFNPVLKTPQALESVQWRGAGAALAHGSGVCWMDLWGNGWLRTASIWKRAATVQKALIERMGSQLENPDVIVFIDERALAYLVDENAFTLLVQNVRDSVLRSGLSAGFYLLSDLAHRETFPEAKLYIFLNAWDLRPDLRAAIKNRLQRDNKVLFWLYAAGLFDAGRDSLERAREVTGIALKPQPYHSKSGTSVLSKRHPLCEAFPNRGLIGGTKLEPSYFAIPEGSTVLGEYTQTGLPSFVIKEFSGDGDPSIAWTSVFLGEPIVSPALIRALGQLAGAHVYDFQEDLVHAGFPFLTVHCHAAGPRTITLPPNWVAYNLQQGAHVKTEGNSIRFTAADGSTHVFLVGPPAVVEGVLATSPDTMLTIDELPTRPENVLQGDALNFDIPIMKLGDWIEGGLTDEAAEDWLLRPLAVEEESEPESNGNDGDGQRGGRRRRRRRGGRGRGGESSQREPDGPVSTVSVSSGSDDFEMNVVFRKRE